MNDTLSQIFVRARTVLERKAPEGVSWAIAIKPKTQDVFLNLEMCCARRTECIPFEVFITLGPHVLERLLSRMECEAIVENVAEHQKQHKTISVNLAKAVKTGEITIESIDKMPPKIAAMIATQLLKIAARVDDDDEDDDAINLDFGEILRRMEDVEKGPSHEGN